MATDARAPDYRPINLAKKELRLLELQTGRDINDPVVCRLVNVRVTDDTEFIGLCALFGNPGETEHIFINDRKIAVPANVGQALRHVRAAFLREQGHGQGGLYQTNSNNTVHSKNGADSIDGVTSPKPAAATVSKPQKQRQPEHQRSAPRWLRNLLRGFKSILPDDAAHSTRQTPLRIWIECLCIDPRSTREDEERRSHLTMAYRAAKLVVGWLGPRDETSDHSIEMLRTLDSMCPPDFGEPEDRRDHPENYSPRMDWARPLGEAWASSMAEFDGDPLDSPMFLATRNFLSRPFFHRRWILEDLALSRFPAFLLGQDIISWMQILRWNRCNEEFREGGSIYFPKEVVQVADLVDIGIVHTLLEDFSRRRDKTEVRGLTASISPSSSSVSSHYRSRPSNST